MTALRRAVPSGPDRARRRASGELEAAILQALWDAGRPLNAAEVRDCLTSSAVDQPRPAYTTVVTTLTRLQEKGALLRERHGRAYRYTPTADDAGMAARRIARLLDAANDRDTVLLRFVADLSAHDEELLRGLLNHEGSLQDQDGRAMPDGVYVRVESAQTVARGRGGVPDGDDGTPSSPSGQSVQAMSRLRMMRVPTTPATTP
jgi:predicted transcriptional regulator